MSKTDIKEHMRIAKLSCIQEVSLKFSPDLMSKCTHTYITWYLKCEMRDQHFEDRGLSNE